MTLKLLKSELMASALRVVYEPAIIAIQHRLRNMLRETCERLGIADWKLLEADELGGEGGLYLSFELTGATVEVSVTLEPGGLLFRCHNQAALLLPELADAMHEFRDELAKHENLALSTDLSQLIDEAAEQAYCYFEDTLAPQAEQQRLREGATVDLHTPEASDIAGLAYLVRRHLHMELSAGEIIEAGTELRGFRWERAEVMRGAALLKSLVNEAGGVAKMSLKAFAAGLAHLQRKRYEVGAMAAMAEHELPGFLRDCADLANIRVQRMNGIGGQKEYAFISPRENLLPMQLARIYPYSDDSVAGHSLNVRTLFETAAKKCKRL